MVLLCMLAGVLCYGVAVNVGWCSMLAILWARAIYIARVTVLKEAFI